MLEVDVAAVPAEHAELIVAYCGHELRELLASRQEEHGVQERLELRTHVGCNGEIFAF
jgi:hypothetical protein